MLGRSSHVFPYHNVGSKGHVCGHGAGSRLLWDNAGNNVALGAHKQASDQYGGSGSKDTGRSVMKRKSSRTEN